MKQTRWSHFWIDLDDALQQWIGVCRLSGSFRLALLLRWFPGAYVDSLVTAPVNSKLHFTVAFWLGLSRRGFLPFSVSVLLTEQSLTFVAWTSTSSWNSAAPLRFHAYQLQCSLWCFGHHSFHVCGFLWLRLWMVMKDLPVFVYFCYWVASLLLAMSIWGHWGKFSIALSLFHPRVVGVMLPQDIHSWALEKKRISASGFCTTRLPPTHPPALPSLSSTDRESHPWLQAPQLRQCVSCSLFCQCVLPGGAGTSLAMTTDLVSG